MHKLKYIYFLIIAVTCVWGVQLSATRAYGYDPSCYVPYPNLEVEPASLDFGALDHGTSKTLSVAVKYLHGCAANFFAADFCDCSQPNSVTIKLELISATNFQLISSSTQVIQHEVSKNLSVRFNAPLNQGGAFEGILRVYILKSSIPGSHVVWGASDKQIDLVGISNPPAPNLSANKSSFDFDPTPVNTSSNDSIILKNEGDATLTVNMTPVAPFTISPQNFSLAPNGQRTVTMTFTPGIRGLIEKQILVNTNDPDLQSFYFTAAAEGTAPYVKITPTNHSFGEVPVGEVKKLDVTIENLDNNYSSLLSLSNFTDNSSSYYFSLPGDTTLQPGESTIMTVTFDPVSNGTKNASLTFSTNDPDKPTGLVSLSGVGQAAEIGANTLNLDWGDRHLGTSNGKSLIISNNGVQNLMVTSFTKPNSTITVSPGSATIVPNDSKAFTVTYKPTAATTLDSELVVNNTDPGVSNLGIAVTGQGVTPKIETDSLLDFENVYINPANLNSADTREIDLVVSNSGTETLVINNITSTHGAFTSVKSSLSVPAGEQGVLPLRYRPTLMGAQAAMLRIYSNDYFTPLRNVSLSGTGVSALDLSVSAFEVTQAIQNLDNEIPLVAGKTATVRTFVDVELFDGNGPADTVRQVDGLLRIYRSNIEIVGSPFKSENGPIDAFPSPDRTEVDETLNFLVPGNYTNCFQCGGSLDFTFEVELNPITGAHVGRLMENDYVNNKLSEVLTFHQRYRPRIAAIPISYGPATLSCRGLPKNDAITDGADFLKAIFPLGSIDYRMEPPIAFNCDINSLAANCNGAKATTKLHETLFVAGHLAGNNPDLIYGWFNCNPYSGNGQAALNGKTAFGNTDALRYQRTFAHEVGHNLGEVHTSDKLVEVGFDSLLQETRYETGLYWPVSSVRADIMYPGLLTEHAWITDSRYWQFFNKMDPNDPFPGDFTNYFFIDGAFEDVWLVSGDVADDGTAVINPLYETIGPWGEPEAGGQNIPYTLQVLDGDEQVLTSYSVHIDAQFETDAEADLGRPFSLVIPRDPDAAILRLIDANGILAERIRSASAPTLTIVSPGLGDNIGEYLTVSWQGEDADGDALSYTVQYSRDPSAPFSTLGVNLDQAYFEYPAALLAGGANAAVRVIATDGFNSTIADSDFFVVGKKPPLITLVAPKVGVTLIAGVPFSLRSHVQDPEDGLLPDGVIQWASNLDGNLGTGAEVAARLSEGVHQLSVTATDSDGLQASATVDVLVSNGGNSPRASAGLNQEVEEGDSVVLDAAASFDPDEGDSLTYDWAQLAGPSVTINDSGSVNPYFTAPIVNASSLLRFLLTATDNNGNMSTDTVDVQVLNTHFAQMNITNTLIEFGTVNEGNSKEINLVVTNIGNETLTINTLEFSRGVFSVVPEQASIAPQGSQNFKVLFIPDESASYEATLQAITNSISGVASIVVLRGATSLSAQVYDDYSPGGSLLPPLAAPGSDSSGPGGAPSGSAPGEGESGGGSGGGDSVSGGGQGIGCSLIR